MTLADLREREKAIVKSIGDLGELKTRLMELGVLCGEPVQLIRRAPWGDPLEIRVEDTLIALRKADAAKIEVEPISRPRVRKRRGAKR